MEKNETLRNFLFDTLQMLESEFIDVYERYQATDLENAERLQAEFLGVYGMLSLVVQQMKVFNLEPSEFGMTITLDDYL